MEFQHGHKKTYLFGNPFIFIAFSYVWLFKLVWEDQVAIR